MAKDDDVIFEGVQKIIVQTFKTDKALIKKEALLNDHLGLDSVDLLDAVCLAEKEFDIKILEGGSLREAWPQTVADLITLIEKKRNCK